MIDRFFWLDSLVLKSTRLSKKIVTKTEYITELLCIKIKVNFSKRFTRASILIFWFLFLLTGQNSRLGIVKIKKKIKKKHSKNKVFFNMDLRDPILMNALIDRWSLSGHLANIISLYNIKYTNHTASICYGQAIKPGRVNFLTKYDKGVDFFTTRKGRSELLFYFLTHSDTVTYSTKDFGFYLNTVFLPSSL